MRKKTYAVQASENVYKILTDISGTKGIPKMQAIEIMAQAFMESQKAKPEAAPVAQVTAKTEGQGFVVSPRRIFKNAD